MPKSKSRSKSKSKSKTKDYFRVVTPKCDAILHSATPSSAAAKAFTHCVSLQRKMKNKSKVISVQRRSGNKKIMSYKVKAIKNPKNEMIERDGQMIHFKYHTKVKSLNKKMRKSKSKSKSPKKMRKSKSKSKSSKSKTKK
jgi:hypothetical protein